MNLLYKFHNPSSCWTSFSEVCLAYLTIFFALSGSILEDLPDTINPTTGTSSASNIHWLISNHIQSSCNESRTFLPWQWWLLIDPLVGIEVSSIYATTTIPLSSSCSIVVSITNSIAENGWCIQFLSHWNVAGVFVNQTCMTTWLYWLHFVRNVVNVWFPKPLLWNGIQLSNQSSWCESPHWLELLIHL